MTPFADDTGLFAATRRTRFTAVVGEILDTVGRLHQVLSPGIRALCDEVVTIGRVKPLGLMIEVRDRLKQHEVDVASGSSSLRTGAR